MAKNHGMGKLKGIGHFCEPGNDQTRSDRFGRLFPHLSPSFTAVETLQYIGKDNGPMDGGTTVNRTNSVDVGHVIFGQFVDHDITLDVESSLGTNVSGEIGNLRTPTLDLDCIYGPGPEDAPFMYHSDGPFEGVKLVTGADEPGADANAEEDLFRAPVIPAPNSGNPRGRAIIGDHRNDENRIISQMQLGMIRYHNYNVDQLSSASLKGHDLYLAARRATSWHYQWLVVNEFLPKMCGQGVVNRILGCGRKFYCPNNEEPFIPIEFSVAAYRFGHSMIPQNVQIRAGDPGVRIFGTVLGRGFSPVESQAAVVEWPELFDIDSSVTQKAETLNSKLADVLLKLPFIPVTDERSLATRNLLRGNVFMLPAGEKVAEKMGRPAQEIEDVVLKVKNLSGDRIRAGIPLWLYILCEAEIVGREDADGLFEQEEGLGPVGATIVAETILGLLELDPHSYLGANRNWGPTTGPRTIGEMLMLGA